MGEGEAGADGTLAPMGEPLRRCASGGLAVGTDDWLPATPFDRDFGALFPPVGCNRLTCTRCGARVASWPELAASSATDPALLYAALDPRSAPGVEPRPGIWRLYACRCRFLTTAAPMGFGSGTVPDQSLADLVDPAPEWTCSGHPALSWPCEIDGIRLDDATDLDALVEGTLAGRLPASAPWTTTRTERPAFWLARVCAALAPAPAPAAARLAELVARRLESEDPRVLRHAWAFFEHLPDAAGAERLAGAFSRRKDRLGALVDPLVGKTPMIRFAVDALLRRLSVRDPDGRPTDREAVAALVAAPPGTVPDSLRASLAERGTP